VALFFVLIAAIAWGVFVWRDRRRRAGYAGLFGTDPDDGSGRAPEMASGLGLNGFSDRRPPVQGKEQRDVEAARDYDETELDDLSGGGGGGRRMSRDEAFGLADSEDEDDGRAGRANGRMG
jgi:carboxypeptidase D